MAVRRVHIGGASITNYREIFEFRERVWVTPLVFSSIPALRNPLTIGYRETHRTTINAKNGAKQSLKIAEPNITITQCII